MWKKFKTTTNPVISLPPISIRSSLADKVEQNHSNREIQSPTKNVKLNDGLFLRREDQIRKPIQNQKLQQEKAENLPDIFTMPQRPDTLLRQNQKKSRWYNDHQRDKSGYMRDVSLWWSFKKPSVCQSRSAVEEVIRDATAEICPETEPISEYFQSILKLVEFLGRFKISKNKLKIYSLMKQIQKGFHLLNAQVLEAWVQKI